MAQRNNGMQLIQVVCLARPFAGNYNFTFEAIFASLPIEHTAAKPGTLVYPDGLGIHTEICRRLG
jgi:hypothetical protein